MQSLTTKCTLLMLGGVVYQFLKWVMYSLWSSFSSRLLPSFCTIRSTFNYVLKEHHCIPLCFTLGTFSRLSWYYISHSRSTMYKANQRSPEMCVPLYCMATGIQQEYANTLISLEVGGLHAVAGNLFHISYSMVLLVARLAMTF